MKINPIGHMNYSNYSKKRQLQQFNTTGTNKNSKTPNFGTIDPKSYDNILNWLNRMSNLPGLKLEEKFIEPCKSWLDDVAKSEKMIVKTEEFKKTLILQVYSKEQNKGCNPDCIFDENFGIPGDNDNALMSLLKLQSFYEYLKFSKLF